MAFTENVDVSPLQHPSFAYDDSQFPSSCMLQKDAEAAAGVRSPDWA